MGGGNHSHRIVTVRPDGAHLDGVMSLGRQNTKTLGFFPKGAFLDYASRGHIRAYVDGDDIGGYLAFRIHHLTVVIVHLCVADDFRNRGIGKALVDDLCERSGEYAAIRANCRVDFPADAVWPRLGFVPRGEKPGRSTQNPTILRVWVRDLGLPDLFSTAPSDRVVAALDTNVLLDIHGDASDRHRRESKALFADWLADSIEYVLTAEAFDDIRRNPDSEERKALLAFASTFRVLPDHNSDSAQERLNDLTIAIGTGESRQDQSDRRQLAFSAVGGAQYFLTRDEAILELADKIDDTLGVVALRPCDLIARTHADLVDQTFAPRRLLGSALTVRPFAADEIDGLVRTFQAFARREKKGPLLGLLRTSLAHSERSTGLLVLGESQHPLGLLVMDTGVSETRIRLLRTTAGPIADVLARHLVWLSVQTARRAGHRTTRLLDDHIPTAAKGVLGVLGFRPGRQGMAKVNGIGVGSASELADQLEALRSVFRNTSWISDTVSDLGKDPSLIPPRLAFQYERVSWPAKLFDTDLPSFIVPIRPEWASRLFHYKLAEQSLFGVDPRLMLRLDNVYYRSAVPRRIEAPARVLWYVATSKESPDTGCIAATSLIADVVHGPAKSVFSRFERYGVFEWKNVLDLAKGKPHGIVQAFRFEHTEPFDTPVPLERIRDLARETRVGDIVFQSPSRVSSEFFGAVYREGFGRDE